MRLLNDEEIEGKYNGYGWRNPTRLEMAKLRPIAKAQDIKTHKADLREFIEWGDTYCVEGEEHGRDSNYANVKKHECRQCWQSLKQLVEPECEHDWFKLRNEVITSGEMCSKCHALRAEQLAEGE